MVFDMKLHLEDTSLLPIYLCYNLNRPLREGDEKQRKRHKLIIYVCGEYKWLNLLYMDWQL